jgi:hypothetical protein
MQVKGCQRWHTGVRVRNTYITFLYHWDNLLKSELILDGFFLFHDKMNKATADIGWYAFH